MYKKGLTLIEILVVFAILAILLLLTLMFIKPKVQLDKVRDAARKSDIIKVKTALDAYYYDNKCYPSSLDFGSPLQYGKTLYMAKIPQDAQCETGVSCYAYVGADGCSQWNILFAKLSRATTSSPASCSLSQLSNCRPADYDSSWSCTISGNFSYDATDCSYLTDTYLDSTPDYQSKTQTQTTVQNTTIQTCSCDFTLSGSTCNYAGTNLGMYCDRGCSTKCN